MSAQIQVIFYSTHGHICKLTEAVGEGAGQALGSDLKIFQVAEIHSANILSKMGATEAKKAFAHLPIADPKQLADADALILDTPTRFGCKMNRSFLDSKSFSADPLQLLRLRRKVIS